MSAHWFNWARRQHVPQSAAKFVLVMLGDAAAEETALGFASVAYLCEVTELDRKTVLRSLARLQEWGFIVDTGKKTGRTKSITVYRLVAKPSSTEIGTSSEPSAAECSENEAVCGSQRGDMPSDDKQSQKRDGSENGTASDGEVVPEEAPLEEPSSPEIGTASDGSSPNFPSKQSQNWDTERRANQDQKPKPRPRAGAHVREGEGLDAEQPEAEASAPSPFDAFWAIYPVQVARIECERKWRAMDLDALSPVILADVARRKQHDPQWLRSYIPNPKRYLDGRRWEDKPPGVAGSVAAAATPRPSIYGNPMDPLECELAIIADQFRFDVIDEAERDRLVAAAHAKYPVAA
jgi:biotin operon repressor